jgi:hypothetical protein
MQQSTRSFLRVSGTFSAEPTNTYFTVQDERCDGGRFLAGPGSAGPWSPALAHGGPPSALVVRAAERRAAEHVASNGGVGTFTAMRLAAEFLGPVPVGEVDVTTRVLRAARSALLVEATLHVADRVCLSGRVWLLREWDTSAVAEVVDEPVSVPDDLPDLGADFPYHHTIDWQSYTGAMARPGPGRAWARPHYRLVAGEELTGLQRVALVGDSSSGISSELDWDAWSFVNVDLDVHLSRPVHGEWVLIDAETQVGTAGAALARSTVSDVLGPVGSTAQTLVLAPR